MSDRVFKTPEEMEAKILENETKINELKKKPKPPEKKLSPVDAFFFKNEKDGEK